LLVAAKAAGTRPAAMYARLLDTGCRISEALGLQWKDIDFDEGTVITRQLAVPGHEPVFGPLKRGGREGQRCLSGTLSLLREHKRAQAEVTLKNRLHYVDDDLVFGKEQADITSQQDLLELPLYSSNLARGEFARILKAANVKRISYYGTRHTCVSLLLAAGIPANVVDERVGHKDATITFVNLRARLAGAAENRRATPRGVVA